METFFISMAIAFMSKILQSKFRMLPGSAALLFGSTSVPAAFLGNLLGKERKEQKGKERKERTERKVRKVKNR